MSQHTTKEASPSVERRVLDAAADCTARVGLDNVLIDDIVQKSGVSRATVYRRFGSRDAVLRAMILEQAQPYINQSAEIAAGPGSFASRLEEVIIITIASFNDYPWSPFFFKQGVSRATLQLLKPLTTSFRNGALATLLQQAGAEGYLRPHLPLDRLHDWLRQQMIFAGERWQGDRAAIRVEVRQFILPVLLQDSNEANEHASVTGKLERIERKLDELAKAIKRYEAAR